MSFSDFRLALCIVGGVGIFSNLLNMSRFRGKTDFFSEKKVQLVSLMNRINHNHKNLSQITPVAVSVVVCGFEP